MLHSLTVEPEINVLSFRVELTPKYLFPPISSHESDIVSLDR